MLSGERIVEPLHAGGRAGDRMPAFLKSVNERSPDFRVIFDDENLRHMLNVVRRVPRLGLL